MNNEIIAMVEFNERKILIVYAGIFIE